MNNPISSATEEKTSAGKFNTETIIPEKFELTDEFKNTYNLINKTNDLLIEGKNNWTEENDKKLIALYKKNVPEIALSKIFKKNISEIRSRILKLI